MFTPVRGRYTTRDSCGCAYARVLEGVVGVFVSAHAWLFICPRDHAYTLVSTRRRPRVKVRADFVCTCKRTCFHLCLCCAGFEGKRMSGRNEFYYYFRDHIDANPCSYTANTLRLRILHLRKCSRRSRQQKTAKKTNTNFASHECHLPIFIRRRPVHSPISNSRLQNYDERFTLKVIRK